MCSVKDDDPDTARRVLVGCFVVSSLVAKEPVKFGVKPETVLRLVEGVLALLTSLRASATLSMFVAVYQASGIGSASQDGAAAVGLGNNVVCDVCSWEMDLPHDAFGLDDGYGSAVCLHTWLFHLPVNGHGWRIFRIAQDRCQGQDDGRRSHDLMAR